MRAKFFVKGMDVGVFEQDVQVTETVVHDVPVNEGDEVLVQVRGKVARVVETADGTEIDLREMRPVRVQQVLRPKGSTP